MRAAELGVLGMLQFLIGNKMRFIVALLISLWSSLALAQTVPLSFFGSSTFVQQWPSFPIGTTRTWGNCDVNSTCSTYPSGTPCVSSNGYVQWPGIEPSKGTFNWVALDNVMAQYQTKGVDVIFTLGGYTPGWANGSAGCGVGPLSNQDFYDFVTAVVTRYKGKIKYYELWNEPNLSVYWTGTVAQLETIGAAVYPLIKAIDPAALVLSPVNIGNTGIPWMNTYLSISGAGATFDIYSFHAYFDAWLPGTQPPEFIQTMVNYNAIQNQTFGLNYPIFITEMAENSTSTPVDPRYPAIEYLLEYASGVSRAVWFRYTTNTTAGNLTGSNQGLNAAGAAYRVVASWMLNANFTSPVGRVSNTNGIRNTTATGAISGTPGTLPTNWTTGYADSSFGISVQVTANSGSIDWRVFGTATAGASGQTQIGFEQINHIAASLGQYWTFGANISLVGGSYTNVSDTYLSYNEYSSGGSYLATDGFIAFAATNLATQNYWTTTQTVNSSVAFVDGNLSIQYTVGQPIDITLRLSLPSMDNGTIYSGNLTESNSVTAQIAWDSAGGPTTFSAGSFGFYRDLTGATYAVSGGNVTLTNSPIILESAAQKGWLN